MNDHDRDAVLDNRIYVSTNLKIMEPVTILVLVAGIVVTFLVARGLYESRREMMEEYETQRRQKLSYRTEEEFIENPSEQEKF